MIRVGVGRRRRVSSQKLASWQLGSVVELVGHLSLPSAGSEKHLNPLHLVVKSFAQFPAPSQVPAL